MMRWRFSTSLKAKKRNSLNLTDLYLKYVLSLFVVDMMNIVYFTALFLYWIVVDEGTSAVQTVGPAIDHEELPRRI